MQLHAEQSTDTSEDSKQEDDDFPWSPGFDGEGVLIAMPGILHTVPTKTWQYTGYLSHTNEAALLEVTCEIAPHASYIFYRMTNAHATAPAISQLAEEWHKRTDTTLHSFVICIPSGWKYNKTLEAAINRARAAGIHLVCAARRGRAGMVYPALGNVFCIGAVNPDGSLAPYSASGSAVDYVESGVIVRRCGTGVSAARFTGHLALVLQLIYNSTGHGIKVTATLKEFLLFATNREHTSGMGYGRADFKSLMKRPAMQIMEDVKHIAVTRDRREYHADPSRGDAKANTEHWSFCRTLNPNPSLSGAGISLAVIDDISESCLDHVNKHHGIEIKREIIPVDNGKKRITIQHFYIIAKDLMQECCKPYYKGTQGHVLQCGAIVANISPNCRLLLIKHHKDDPGEKGALEVVKRERPHILNVSAVTTDISDSFSVNLLPLLSCCVVLCAAGNEGKTDRNTICYPARTGNLIVIGACDQLGNRCPYSSVGRELSLLCPGQFDIADAMGRGGTCYAASAGGAVIAQLCQLIRNTCGRVRIHIEGRKETIPTLACNTYLMRSLLCDPSMGLCSRAEHSPTEGHGMLQIDKLSTLTPEMLVQYIRSFYT